MSYAAIPSRVGQLSPPIQTLDRSFSNPPLDTYPEKPPSVSLGLVKGHESRYRRLRMRYKTLFPTLLVFVLTSGAGIALLAWLWSKRKMSASEAFSKGYILVDEGVEREEGIESATLRALTATSFISTFISLASPVIMALITYRIAYLWMREQTNLASGNVGPTPLQYGLLLQVLSAPGISTLYSAVCYLFKGKSRPRAPSYFSSAVILGVTLYLITNLVGFADLWLHTTTKAVLFNLTSPDSSSTPLMTSIAFNQSLCSELDWPGESNTVCMSNSDAWAGDEGEEFLTLVGQSVISNSSLDRTVITLADAEDLSVVVPLVVNKHATFKATSFGAHARCKSLNHECIGQQTINMINCSNIGITAIPTDGSIIASTVLVAPYDKWDGPPVSLDNSNIHSGPKYCCATNPVQSLLQLRWSSQRDGRTEPPNPAVHTYPIPLISIYASCEITFYNVTLAYDGRAVDDKYWSLVPKETVPSNDGFATILAAPYAWQLVTDTLVTNIRGRAMSSNSTERVMAALNQELSRLSLGYVSGGFRFAPATDVKITTPMILGRYPLAPVFTFTILLFIYGFIALAVFAMSFGVSSDAILVPAALQVSPKDADGKEIPIVELAQQRLLGPAPLIAQLFAEPLDPMNSLNPSDADARSVATSNVELLGETAGSSSYNEPRLRIGLENTALRPRFGIWKCNSGDDTRI